MTITPPLLGRKLRRQVLDADLNESGRDDSFTLQNWQVGHLNVSSVKCLEKSLKSQFEMLCVGG